MGRREQMQGSSLPEVLVATTLLLVLLAPLVSLFAASRLTAVDAGRKTGAINVARTWLERFLGMDWTTMDAYLASSSNGFLETTPSARWERTFSPDPDTPQYQVQVVVATRRLRDPLADDAMPDQLTVRDITVTVRWQQKDTWFTVQQATAMHRR